MFSRPPTSFTGLVGAVFSQVTILVEGDVIQRMPVVSVSDDVEIDVANDPIDHGHDFFALMVGRTRMQRQRTRNEIVLNVDNDQGADRSNGLRGERNVDEGENRFRYQSNRFFPGLTKFVVLDALILIEICFEKVFVDSISENEVRSLFVGE